MVNLGVDVEKPKGCSITSYFNGQILRKTSFFIYIVKFGLTMEFAEVPA